MLERQDELCTSTLTLAEVLVKPLARGDEALRQRYEQAFAQAVRVIAFDRDAARLYAEIRQDRAIRAPDAFQLACAGATCSSRATTGSPAAPFPAFSSSRRSSAPSSDA